MSKVKIKIVLLGYLSYSINLDKVRKWKSALFEIISPINTVAIVGNSDISNWGYSDQNIEGQLPPRDGEDILLAVTNVPIQDNYYFRRFADNRVCLTYYEMTEIIKLENIPMENLLLRALYSVSFVYRRFGGKIPLMKNPTNYTHDETRGCIFDMNGIKTDIIYSLNKPQLCHSCVETLMTIQKNKIEKEIVEKVQRELKKIKKGFYYRLIDYIKKRPIFSIFISSIIAIILSAIGSLLASLIL